MDFCTAINCMDGRIQKPVISYMDKKFNAKYIDMITEAGVCCVLSDNKDQSLTKNLLKKIGMSIKRGSQGIAVVGHFDCIGNPVSKEIQIKQIHISMDILKEKYPDVEIIGLWVDENSDVNQI